MSLPEEIEFAMENSLIILSGALRATVQESDTHRVVWIEGWNDNQDTRQAVAHYLVGLRVSAIDAALTIQANLDNTEEDRLEILNNVIAIIGVDNNLSIEQKQKERNPWIAEGIWHMCMAIAAGREDIHPNGRIIALDYAHVIAKDHGLDVAAIYSVENHFGLSLVETKAYREEPNSAISDAVAFFKEVDNGKHALRIRQTVQVMRSALTREQQAKISPSFWKKERTYLPNPHYQHCHDNPINWANNRPSFRSLKLSRLNIVIMPHGISNFSDFFDQISDEMRNFARGLHNV